jgi:hypothetical protein
MINCRLREYRLSKLPSNLHIDKHARTIYAEIELLKLEDSIPVDYKYMIHGQPGRDHTVQIIRNRDGTLLGSFTVPMDMINLTYTGSLRLYLYDSIMNEFTSTTHTASVPA